MEEKLKETLVGLKKQDNIYVVTADQIMQLANDIFKDKNLNLALIGPFKEKAKFLKNLKF